MTIKRNNSGFTLLEIIIVIIIVGVLASLALPRLFASIEFSRSTEALAALGMVRKSMERCYLMSPNRSYLDCPTFADLDMDDPATAAGNHFTYGIGGLAGDTFTITATRNNIDGGDNSGATTIFISQDNTAGSVTRGGTTAFQALQ